MSDRGGIEPDDFLVRVRDHMNVSVGGGGHHPGAEYTPAAFRHYIRERALLARLARLDFATALDVGCAEGYFMEKLRERFGTDVWGVDISDLAAKAVQDRYRMQSAVADAQRLPFADGSFDLVYSTEVIEHVLEPATMVAEMRRVARRWAVVSTPVTLDATGHEPDYEQRAEGHINSFDPAFARATFGPEAELGSFRCNATLAAIVAAGRFAPARVREAFYAADHGVSRRLGSATHRFTPLRNRDWLAVIPATPSSEATAPEWRCPSCHGPLTTGVEAVRCVEEDLSYRFVLPGVVDFALPA